MAERLVNRITISVFCKEDEDYDKLKKNLLGLFSFDLYEHGLVQEKKAVGFNERVIRQIFIELQNQQHIREFLDILNQMLDRQQKKQLLSQKESRLSDKYNFYVRLDKKKFLDSKFSLTESGDCIHIRINIAAFPRKRDRALENIEQLFQM